MKIDDIRELIHLMDASSMEELTFERDGVRLHLKKAAQAGGAARPAESEQNGDRSESAMDTENNEADPDLHQIVAPMVGTFYQAPAPDAEPYVQVGDRVDENTVVCIVEAMKLMNEIEAEVTGEVVKVLVENGQLVEYGQPLFLVKTS